MKKPQKRGWRAVFESAGVSSSTGSSSTGRDFTGRGSSDPDEAPEGVEPAEGLEPENEPLEALDSPDAGSEPPGVATREVISRKELARQLRRQAYQRAKAARASDPKHLAMKEVAKQRRRELYQQVKEKRKARDAERDAERKTVLASERTAAKRQLAERVKSAIGAAAGAAGPAPGLARDIERALQCADVKELMERLRADSATLAAQDRDDGSSS